jgi:uncharacterized protein
VQITVLAATGGVGRELTRQGLERGHTVTALARTPARLDLPDSARLRRISVDVRDPAALARALVGSEVVLSGLGAVKGESPTILSAGARAVLAAAPPRVIWLGAFGTGASAPVAGALTRRVLALALGREIPDKVAADSAVLAAGGTVFHSGPMTDGALSRTWQALPLSEVPRRWFPKSISRATVAAAVLDEAETALRPGQVVVPLSRNDRPRPSPRPPRCDPGRAEAQ